MVSLTHVSIVNKDFVIDFGKAVEIFKVICISRGDGNGVYPENIYELYYYDLDGWQFLGRKCAVDYCIEFENVPTGALLWLINITAGVEERPFTVENGVVSFW